MTTIVPRVNYFDKQFLRVDEFRDEQLYQLSLRRRHNVVEHSWGIVSGLDIANEAGALVVRSGMAIDGYGRELVLADKKRLDTNAFDDLGTDQLDVWLVYDRSEMGAAPTGYAACMAEGGPAYRSNEIPQILLERPLSRVVDASRPPGVSTELLTAALPPLSDDRKDLWRVYLGRVTRMAQDQYVIEGTYRLYVGLVGETVDHPANGTRLEIGKQSSVDATRVIDGTTFVYQKGETDTEARRFAVFIPEDQQAGAMQPVPLSPRLEILKDGTIRMRGRTVINGSLRLAAGAVQFLDAAAFTTGSAPSVPSMYRVESDGSDQLRIDLGSSDTANRQFVIGFSSDDGKFTECLKLELKDTTGSGKLLPVLTIYGDLKVEGKLIGNYVPRGLDQDALNALLASFQSGVAAGTVTP